MRITGVKNSRIPTKTDYYIKRNKKFLSIKRLFVIYKKKKSSRLCAIDSRDKSLFGISSFQEYLIIS